MAKANPWVQMGHAVLRGLADKQGQYLPYSDPDRPVKMQAAQLDMDAAKARMANAAAASQLQQQQFGLSENRFGLDQQKFEADQAYRQQVLEAEKAAADAKARFDTATMPAIAGGTAGTPQPGPAPGIDPVQVLAGLEGGAYPSLFNQPGEMPEDTGPRPIPEILGEIEQKDYTQEGLKRKLQLGRIGEAIADPNLRPMQRLELADQFYSELERSRLGDFEIIEPTMEEVVGKNMFEGPNGMIAIRKPDGGIEHRDNTSKREELDSAERVAKFNAHQAEISQDRTEKFQQQQVQQEADNTAAADKVKARQAWSKETLAKRPWNEWLTDSRKDLVQRYKDANAGRKVQPWTPTPEQTEEHADWLYDQAFEKEYSKTQPGSGVVRKPIDPVDATNKWAEENGDEYAKQFAAMRTKMEDNQESPDDGTKPLPISDEDVFLELTKTRPEYLQQVGRRVAAQQRAMRKMLGPVGEELLRQQMLEQGAPPEMPPVAPGSIEMPPGEPPINPTQLAPGDMMMPASPLPIGRISFPVPPSGDTTNFNDLSAGKQERLMRDAVPFNSEEEFQQILADPRAYPGMPVQDAQTGDVFQLKPSLFDEDPLSRPSPSSDPMLPAKEQEKETRKRFGKEAARKVIPQVNEPKESKLMSYLGGTNISFGGEPIPSRRKKKLDAELKKASKLALADEKSRRQARGKLLDKALNKPSSVDPEATALAIQEGVQDYENLTKAQQRQIDKLIDPSGTHSNGRAELQESLFR